jgi:tetratricopeptide (TPR) repeat protein
MVIENQYLGVYMKENIKEAYEYAKKEQYEKALGICNQYINDQLDEREGYKQRSLVLARMNNYEDAIRDLNRLIESGSEEPDDFFTRGCYSLEIGNQGDAIDDFTMVIKIEDKYSLSYYTESAYFYRAVANLMAKFYRNTIEDCEKVRDGFRVYVLGQIRTKEGIIEEARGSIE